MPVIDFRTLGTLDLRRPDGSEIHSLLVQPKRIALLAYLCTAKPLGFHRRDTLLALLWPESDQAHARTSLRTALHVLRRSLGEDLLQSRGDEEIAVSFDALRCDASVFEDLVDKGQLTEALQLFRGDFLPGFFVDAAPAFERWLDIERPRLRALAAHAAHALSEQRETAGNLSEALILARRAVELSENDEKEVRRLIGLLGRSGNLAAALHAYDDLARHLAQEYEARPSPETRALISSLRSENRTDHVSPLQREGGTLAAALPVAKAVQDPSDRPRLARWSVRFAFAAAAIAVAVFAAANWATRDFGEPAARVTSVAVLPLDNLTGDPRQDYFVEGMYNALIGELAQFSALRVISRGSATRYAGTQSSVSDIARELKVDAIVKGGVIRSGDSVSVLIHLVGTRPERELWAGSYKRNLRDILSLHDEVARAIATEVEGRLPPRANERTSHTRPVNPAAYDAWLKGSYHASRRSGADLDACFRFARQAAAADPMYAPAYQLLADCYNIATFVNTSFPGEMFEGAKRAARRALALDETLAPAHAALAYAKAHYDWDWQGAEQSYRRALQLNPALGRAEEDLAWLLSWDGRYDEALLHARKSEQLNPFSPQAALRVAMILHFARRDDEAIAKARRAIALDSAFMFAHSRLHWAYYAKGQHGLAVAAAERAVALSGPGDVRRKAFLAHAYAMNGQRAKGRALLDQLLKLQSETYVPPTAIATVYVALRDKERALSWLERSYDGRDGDMVLLKVFPVWDPLRDDPRFKTLIRRMRFAE